jgi:hypothetical protein
LFAFTLLFEQKVIVNNGRPVTQSGSAISNVTFSLTQSSSASGELLGFQFSLGLQFSLHRDYSDQAVRNTAHIREGNGGPPVQYMLAVMLNSTLPSSKVVARQQLSDDSVGFALAYGM